MSKGSIVNLLQWFSASESRHFRSIMSFVIVGVVVLGASGIILTLLWPENWSELFASYLVGLLASFIGVLVTIPIAISIVEGYLERRKREIEKKEQQEEKVYQTYWSAHIYGALEAFTEYLIQISLFVAFGKDKYLQVNGKDHPDFSDTFDSFIKSLMKKIEDLVEEDNSQTTSSFHSNEYLIQVIKVFQETPTERNFTTNELMLLLSKLEALQVTAQSEMYLLTPYMSRNMDTSNRLVSVNNYLGRAIRNIERIMLKPATENNKLSAKFCLDSNQLSTFSDLGEKSAELKLLINAENRRHRL